MREPVGVCCLAPVVGARRRSGGVGGALVARLGRRCLRRLSLRLRLESEFSTLASITAEGWICESIASIRAAREHQVML